MLCSCSLLSQPFHEALIHGVLWPLEDLYRCVQASLIQD